jgi:cytoskeletal protein CcmA (bactofilin family)
MPIWKDQKDVATAPPEPTPTKDIPRTSPMTAADDSIRRTTGAAAKESLIAADLTIEGKIEGAGHVRIAGKFKGDIHVQGNLTIEVGAKVTGGVRANTVTIAGELEGNIDAAARVELLETGVLNGDLKAGSLTVAAGSRMRGNAEFGWDERGGGAKATFGAERSTAA